MDNNKLDDIFKAKLQSFEPEFVQDHWTLMQQSLASAKNIAPVKSSSSRIYKKLALLLLFLMSAGVMTYVGIRIFENKPAETSGVVSDNAAMTRENLPTYPNADLNTRSKVSSDKISNNATADDKVINSETNYKPIAQSKPDAHATLPKPDKTDASKTSGSNNGNKDRNADNSSNSVNIGSDKVVKKDVTKDIQSAKSVNVSDEELKKSDNESTVVTDQKIENDNSESSENISALISKKSLRQQKASERKTTRAGWVESVPDNKVTNQSNINTNPAFSGFSQKHSFRISMNVFKPFYQPEDDFNIPFNYGIAYDFTFGKRKNYALGLSYNRALGGADGYLAIDATFAYRFLLAKNHYLRMGASVGYFASDIYKESLNFGDMIDPIDGFVYNTQDTLPQQSMRSNIDVSLGALYSYKSLFIGFSIKHLTSPKTGVITDYRLRQNYIFNSGYILKLSKTSNAMPMVEMQYDGQFFKISPAALFTIRKWYLVGLEFKDSRNAGIMLGYNHKDNLQINIKGGIPLNSEVRKNFGIVEYAGFSMRFQFGGKD